MWWSLRCIKRNKDINNVCVNYIIWGHFPLCGDRIWANSDISRCEWNMLFGNGQLRFANMNLLDVTVNVWRSKVCRVIPPLKCTGPVTHICSLKHLCFAPPIHEMRVHLRARSKTVASEWNTWRRGEKKVNVPLTNNWMLIYHRYARMNRLSQGVRLTFLILFYCELRAFLSSNRIKVLHRIQEMHSITCSCMLLRMIHHMFHVRVIVDTLTEPLYFWPICAELSVNYLHFYGKSERVNILAEKRWGLIPREATPAAYLNAIVVCPSDCDDGKKT